jgi:FkbM family methyltransferase
MRPRIMVSYAQNFEDVMLARALQNVDDGFYVDVGAWDPNTETVTRYFYDIGWHGINIEPVPAYHELLQGARPRDINLRVAIGKEEGRASITTFEGTGMSTLDASVASRQERLGFSHEKLEVQVRTLNAVFEQYAPRDVHFLKIDCEGAEADVVNSFDLAKYRPWIIVVEAVDPSSREETHADWESHLIASDYLPVYFDGLNRFYLAVEHRHLAQHFMVPPNVFDDFTVARFWGPQSRSTPMQQFARSIRDRLRNTARLLAPDKK